MRALVTVLASLTSLAVCSSQAFGEAPTASRDSYVALGDSYTSGPGLPEHDPNAPQQCVRSNGTYPKLLAQQFKWELTDVSCGGAGVQNLYKSQSDGVPPQLDAVHHDADVVSMGIGANDNNLFYLLVIQCGTAASEAPGSPAPCRDAHRAQALRGIAADEENIRAAIRAVRKAAPRAQVILVGYPSLVPKDVATKSRCIQGGLTYTYDDMDFIDATERVLNAMLAEAAAKEGAIFADTYTPSLGHDMCQAREIRWVEPQIPGSTAAPVHPNASGMAADAKAVERALARQSSDS